MTRQEVALIPGFLPLSIEVAHEDVYFAQITRCFAAIANNIFIIYTYYGMIGEVKQVRFESR